MDTALGQATDQSNLPQPESMYPNIVQPDGFIRQGGIVTYLLLFGAFMITSGILLARYELEKTRRDRVGKLRQRARRGVRINR